MSKTSPQRCAAAVRDAKALELRIAGLSYREIAEKIGVSGAGASWKNVQRALARLVPIEGAEGLRKVELERLSELHKMLWPQIGTDERGLKILDRVLQITDRRIRLAGLDKLKVEIERPQGPTWDEVRQALLAGDQLHRPCPEVEPVRKEEDHEPENTVRNGA